MELVFHDLTGSESSRVVSGKCKEKPKDKT